MQTASERKSAVMPANFFNQRDGNTLTDDRLKSTKQKLRIPESLCGT